MDCIITLEIGTTSTKVVVFDMLGKQIASNKGAYPTFHNHTHISEQDPEQVFITALFVLKSIINNHLLSSKRKVRAIVFSSSMHSVLPVDKNGNPLGNAIIWSDNRAASIAEDLKKTALGDEIYQKTGTPIHAM
nr:FGGY family carbohydrate kinase [Saprospiraceae bacterium]